MASLSQIIGPLDGQDRQPLEGLVGEGLLTRRHGAGTFVAGRVEKNFSKLTSFSEDMTARGRAKTNDAGFLVERRSFLADGRAVEFSQSFYRGDTYDFVAELGDLG